MIFSLLITEKNKYISLSVCVFFSISFILSDFLSLYFALSVSHTHTVYFHVKEFKAFSLYAFWRKKNTQKSFSLSLFSVYVFVFLSLWLIYISLFPFCPLSLYLLAYNECWKNKYLSLSVCVFFLFPLFFLISFLSILPSLSHTHTHTLFIFP